MSVRYRVDVDSPSGGWWLVVDVPDIPEELRPLVDDMLAMALDDLETIYAEEGLRASRDEIASQMLVTLLVFGEDSVTADDTVTCSICDEEITLGGSAHETWDGADVTFWCERHCPDCREEPCPG